MGAILRGGQPVLLKPIRLSHPDSSTKTRRYEWKSDKFVQVEASKVCVAFFAYVAGSLL